MFRAHILFAEKIQSTTTAEIFLRSHAEYNALALTAVSKSLLLFFVGECIGQLRWTSLQDTPRPRALSHVQTYDSASRGPWGSFWLILEHKFRSFVTMGAFITVLTLSFDPFVQQVVTYQDREIKTISSRASVKQSRDFASVRFPGENPIFLSQGNGQNYTTDFLGVMAVAAWSDRSSLDAICPSGQCTWPRFKSIEFCTRCEDVTETSTLVGCENLSYDSLNGTQKSIETSCHLSLPHGRLEGNDGLWFEKKDGKGEFNPYNLTLNLYDLNAPSKVVGYVYEPTGLDVHPVESPLNNLLGKSSLEHPEFQASYPDRLEWHRNNVDRWHLCGH